MSKKWLLRFGSSILAFTLLTGCATTNDNEDEPLEEGPLDTQEQDNLDEGGNGGTNDGTDEGGTNGEMNDDGNNDEMLDMDEDEKNDEKNRNN